MGLFITQAIFILLALLLYGTADRGALLFVFLVIFCWRLFHLFRSGFPNPLREEEKAELFEYHLAQLSNAQSEEKQMLNSKLKLSASTPDHEIASTLTKRLVDEIAQVRRVSSFELQFIAATLLLFPLVIILLVSDIVVLEGRDDWRALYVVASALGLHFGLIRLASFNMRLARNVALLSSLTLLAGIVLLVHNKHPYLNPFASNRAELIANHVLELDNGVVAERHVEYVFDYARLLQEQGELEKCLLYYQAGLRLDAENLFAHKHTSAVARQLGMPQLANYHAQAASSIATGNRPVHFNAEGQSPVDIVDSMTTDSFCLVIVPTHGADLKLIRDAASIVQESLGHSVYLSSASMEMPQADRKRGLLASPQYSTRSVHDAFWSHPVLQLGGPIQVVIITSEDLYTENANFVFASGFMGNHTCVVSYARFESNNQQLTTSRLAKQIISCSIKAMRVPPSNSLDCVTAYVNSLNQFDRKSTKLSAQTRYYYEAHIKAYESRQVK